MLTSSESKDIEDKLLDSGIRCIRVCSHISLDDNIKRINSRSNFPHWNNTLDKLLMFDLVQFDKVVYLDCDMIVLENLDHLFNCKHMSAVAAGKKIYKEWTALNSGLIVYEPSELLSNKILQVLPELLKQKKQFGDQDLLHLYYNNWIKESDLHLDDKYNVFFGQLHYYVNRLNYSVGKPNSANNIAVIHFTGTIKPWTRPLPIRYTVSRILKGIIRRSPEYFKIWSRYQNILRKIELGGLDKLTNSL